ncbi:MAG: PAS domain S-box protein [Phycisphaerales bacterium]|nr:PAS domain S-box protein [Phycisphaerales bacterium]
MPVLLPTNPTSLASSLLAVCLLASAVDAAAPPPASASSPAPWEMRSFLDDAGLADNFIFQVAFGPEGHPWFATADGLHRYDGLRWQRFGLESGLPSLLVRCLMWTNAGELWVGTDAGIGRFSAERFSPRPDLIGVNPRRIVEGGDGTIWVCVDGWLTPGRRRGLLELRPERTRWHGIEDGLPDEYVSDFFEDSRGRQFALTIEGLVQRHDDRWIDPLPQDDADARGYLWSMAETGDGVLLAATSNAIFVRREHGWHREPWQSNAKPSFASGGVALRRGAHDEKRLERWTSDGFEPLTDFAVHPGLIEHAARAPDGSVWCVGHNLLLRCAEAEPRWQVHDVPMRPVGLDAAGRVWLSGAAETWRRDGDGWTVFSGAVDTIDFDREGTAWGSCADGVRRFRPDGSTFTDDRSTLGQFGQLTLAVDAHRGVWCLGRDESGTPTLARWTGDEWQIRPIDPSTSCERGPVADPNGGVWTIVPPTSEQPGRAVHVTDAGERTLDLPPSPASAVPRLLARDDALLIYGMFGVRRFDHAAGTWSEVHVQPGRSVVVGVPSGDSVWFATSGLAGGQSGLARWHDGHITSFPLSTRAHVGRGPDHQLIFSCRNGLLIRVDEDGISPVTIGGTDPAEAAYEDATGTLWAYHGGTLVSLSPDGNAPETSVTAESSRLTEGAPLVLQFAASEPNRPSGDDYGFSWRLDGGPWSPFRLSTQITLEEGLSTGDHRIDVRARDGGMAVDRTPATLTFTVIPVPIQMRWWFWPATAATLILLVSLGAIAVVSRHRIRRYAGGLEAEVDRRVTDLRESEARFRRLVEHAQDAIFLHDFEGNIVDVNHHACASLGYERRELLALNLESIDTSWSPARAGQHRAALRRGEPVRVESTQFRRDGGSFPVESHVGVIDTGGTPLALSLVRDMTSHKANERRRRLIMNELDHRVKNNLTAVLALFQGTLSGATDLGVFRSRFEGRIHALARMHELLAQASWEGACLSEAMRLIVRPFASDDERRLDADGPACTLDAAAAVPFGLALHELATNAAKHGALAHATGRVVLRWRITETGVLQLTWREHCEQPCEPPAEEGCGIRLIRGLIEHELSGRVEFDFERGGLVVRVEALALEGAARPAVDPSAGVGV